MVDGGMSNAEVATAYFTTERYVEQRLALAEVSPKLLEVYAENGMTLALLETFTANPDHARQEQVWDAVRQSHYREPWHVRKMLTETSVPASDKRALFVGIDAYVAAGGPVLPRYLFDEEDSGWLDDVPLLDRLVSEKLRTVADEVAAEGWKWITVSLDLPLGHERGLRPLAGTLPELTRKERKQRATLRDEYDALMAEHDGCDELPDETHQRLTEIEEALDTFESRPAVYDPAEIAIAGVFISVDSDGDLVVDRGYVRPEDEPAATVDADAPEADGAEADGDGSEEPRVMRTVITIGGEPAEPEEDEEGVIRPLSEKLVAELTAHRTLALRDALGANPHVALTALLHKLVRDTFGRSTTGAAVGASVREVYFREQGPDLKDSPYATSVRPARRLKSDLPSDDDALGLARRADEASRLALLAHCVSFGVNALYERPNPISASGISQHGLDLRMAEADRLARTTRLDMIEAGFRPTVENYLGRVPKTRILEAVREGAGDRAADLIAHLKKGDMADEAERLLADTGWLPEPLRPLDTEPELDAGTEGDGEALPAFLADDEAEVAAGTEGDPEHLVAAE